MSNEPESSRAYDFVRAGEDPDLDVATRLLSTGESEIASAFPIFQANTVDGVYVRMRNPTVEALEEKMRELEGGALSVATASGMAAVSQTLFSLLRAGDRLVAHRSIFVGVQSLLNDYVSQLGIEVVQIDLSDSDALARALETPTRVVYLEALVNPTLEVLPAPAIMRAARDAGATVVIDNSILTPLLFRPLEHGADIVIHSATKYLSGHGDVLAGIVTFKDEALGREVHKARRLFGGLLSAQSAFLVLRGMKTLVLRVDAHCKNAQLVAEFLERQPMVARVFYPGLPSAPGFQCAQTFLERFGGVVSFEPVAALDWKRFASDLRLCRPWMSFGDVGTRIQREGPVRLSVGLECAADIIRDLERAFRKQSGS